MRRLGFYNPCPVGDLPQERKVPAQLKKSGLIVTGDIGCYTLGVYAPLFVLDTTACMGASIGQALGLEKAGVPNKIVAVIGDSLSSSFWSLALKRTGFDALVITGAAVAPTYLFIDNDIVHFKKAEHLWGKGSSETEDYIRSEIGDSRVRVASIGPGGENLVRYACITNDINRQAGRAGTGAVMGSKRLKAIALRGTQPIQVRNLEEVERISFDIIQKAQIRFEEVLMGSHVKVILLPYGGRYWI